MTSGQLTGGMFNYSIVYGQSVDI